MSDVLTREDLPETFPVDFGEGANPDAFSRAQLVAKWIGTAWSIGFRFRMDDVFPVPTINLGTALDGSKLASLGRLDQSSFFDRHDTLEAICGDIVAAAIVNQGGRLRISIEEGLLVFCLSVPGLEDNKKLVSGVGDGVYSRFLL